jgi:hypothetical protein
MWTGAFTRVFFDLFFTDDIDFIGTFIPGRETDDDDSEDKSLRSSAVSIEELIDEVSFDKYFL